MILVTEEDPASAAVDEGRAEIDVTFGRGKEEESSAITTAAGFEDRAATTLGAGDAVTGTAWGNAGRLAGPVPITLARNAVIHPSNASNSCFNCATAATWSIEVAVSMKDPIHPWKDVISVCSI